MLNIDISLLFYFITQYIKCIDFKYNIIKHKIEVQNRKQKMTSQLVWQRSLWLSTLSADILDPHIQDILD